jgi:hypothetical protein
LQNAGTEQVKAGMLFLFRRVKPELQGPSPPEECVKNMLSTVEKLDDKMSGDAVGQRGDKDWL